MEQFKKCKVIMLPTENNTNIVKILKDNLHYTTSKNIPGGIYQNLYIISDDKIKQNDWCLNISKNIIYQKDNLPMDIMWKKIIATTDTSLTIDCVINKNKIYHLPQPSQQFIEKYIESYNKNEVITNVLVEYKMKHTGWTEDQSEYTYDEFLKVNPKDNTITIKRLKNSWNREELINIFKNCLKNCDSESGFKYDKFDNWIKENL